MSMKSFDKFCERMILDDPGCKKEVFDERQKQIRLRLEIEALLVYAGLNILNCFVMEFFYQWSESWLTATMLFAVISTLWWLIRCAFNGCLLAVSGKSVQKTSAVTTILIGALNMLRYVFDIGESDYFVKDGKLSKDFVFSLCFLLLIIGGIFMLCVIRHEEKRTAKISKHLF